MPMISVVQGSDPFGGSQSELLIMEVQDKTYLSLFLGTTLGMSPAHFS